jgi:hypothetical protein
MPWHSWSDDVVLLPETRPRSAVFASNFDDEIIPGRETSEYDDRIDDTQIWYKPIHK